MTAMMTMVRCPDMYAIRTNTEFDGLRSAYTGCQRGGQHHRRDNRSMHSNLFAGSQFRPRGISIRPTYAERTQIQMITRSVRVRTECRATQCFAILICASMGYHRRPTILTALTPQRKMATRL